MLIPTLLLTLLSAAPQGAGTYQDSIETWRAERLAHLTAEDGYLAVAGLFWLEPGENTVGTAPDNRVVLPAGNGPAHAGVLFVNDDGTVDTRFEGGAGATIEGAPVGFRSLPYDAGGSDHIQLGRVSFWVMDRDGRPAVRMLDPECPIRKHFEGIQNYPVDPALNLTGTWEPFDPPRDLTSGNVLGFEETTPAYGDVRFTLEGESYTLIPFQDSPEDTVLFFVFADATTAKETYGGGRFLVGALEPDGTVKVDFNKAYNPPCAFNPYTTCPLPPEENHLPVPIRAGEKGPKEPAHP